MKEEIQRCVEMLRQGKVLVYPTDTVWGVGCDATNADAVRHVFDIKKRSESKSMLVLLDKAEHLSQYVRNVPDIAWDLLRATERPTTYIYSGACNLPDIMLPPDGTIAIRIVSHGFCHELIQALGKPLVSTSANISGMASPRAFSEIAQELLSAVDYVVPEIFCDSTYDKPSRIIKFTDDNGFVIVRE